MLINCLANIRTLFFIFQIVTEEDRQQQNEGEPEAQPTLVNGNQKEDSLERDQTKGAGEGSDMVLVDSTESKEIGEGEEAEGNQQAEAEEKEEEESEEDEEEED